jgi:radical SAM protein with 4Fe4S-binding SPASM domain
LIPFFDIYIEYNGSVVPCCNIRSDVDNHREYILGNIAEQKIIDIYLSDKATHWRNKLVYFNAEYHIPCKNCFFASAEANNENIMLIENSMLAPVYNKTPPLPFNLVQHKYDELSNLKTEMDALKQSKSWRLTAPLRGIARKIRNIGN